jgi:hypothetical protein
MRTPRGHAGQRFLVAVAAALLVASTQVACSVVEDFLDPVHADQVAALGGDPSGQHNGPTHRPGQPCLVCHGGLGPGQPDFSVGGTIYRSQTGTVAIQGAVVTLTDAQGTVHALTTNRTGNFYVNASDWVPSYPMLVSVSDSDTKIDMKTQVGRDGSCATCHSDPAGPASAGHVYLVADPATSPVGP